MAVRDGESARLFGPNCGAGVEHRSANSGRGRGVTGLRVQRPAVTADGDRVAIAPARIERGHQGASADLGAGTADMEAGGAGGGGAAAGGGGGTVRPPLRVSSQRS